MNKKFIMLILSILSISALAQNDSVIVVKGQVSDYYISVKKPSVYKGYIADENGKRLEGATVMFKFSPVHYNTDKEGYFELMTYPGDSLLSIYYPGKEMLEYNIRKNPVNSVISLSKELPRTYIKHTNVVTDWFDPKNDVPNTFCNPTNIGYDFTTHIDNIIQNGTFRSTADPILVNFKGDYYLFSTNQAGFFWSKDLSTWNFVYGSFQRLPNDDDQCAPAAYVSGDTLFYTGSTYRGLPIWYSTDPKSGRFKRMIEKSVIPHWDPGFLLDDDGKLYLYYGSSNEYPLKGVEVSRADFHPVSKIENIMHLIPQKHGWERFGMNNDDSTTLAPFTEGSWMNKYKGKYYFQYGAPGTEFKVYADGVYVSDSPLGPFTYQKHNPMSYKPGGFIQGAGHGGTFADNYGKYWHIATCMLSLKYKFERRIGIYPAGFDKDGVMFANTSFGDYPGYCPNKDLDAADGNFTGWMLLSYQKPVTVSSTDENYIASNASDENMRTYWSAATNEPGEWLQMDLGAEKEVMALQVNYYDHKADQFSKAMDVYHQYRIFYSNDGKRWKLAVDKSDNDKDVPHDYIQLKKALKTRYLKIENVHMASGLFTISDFRVFGKGNGGKPAQVKNFTVNRQQNDSRNAMISWDKTENAYGYNVYYGISPKKMYNCITVNGENSYDFRGMDVGTTYYFAIEALGEAGRSRQTNPIKVP